MLVLASQKNRENAQKLIQALIRDSSASSWFWDIVSRNRDATSLAQDLGLSPSDDSYVWSGGKNSTAMIIRFFAIAGFELGRKI